MPDSCAPSPEAHLAACFQAVERVRREERGAVEQLENSLQALGKSVETCARQQQKLDQITAHINAGLLLEDVLEAVYREFSDLIPYQRLGLALVEEGMVHSDWVKSDLPAVHLKKGYASPLAGSSLETIIQTGQPRIINDLEEYLAHRPSSGSTRLLVTEGVRSSLTCPLVANGVPVGFLFFSSIHANTYAGSHSTLFERLAGQLSVIVEKAHLTSELAKQKEAGERQNEELRRLVDLKNTLLGLAAHDLRGPLGFIQMSAAVLSDPAFDLDQNEASTLISDIHRQSTHLLTLIEDLLDVSLIETGKLELKPARLSLRPLLENAVNWHTRVASAKGTRVILEDAPEGEIVADPLRLRQLLDNLISNAVKYSPPGSTVRVAAGRQDGAWQVRVADEGPGIQENDRQFLFKDFSRLSAQPTGGEKSTGLGLAISRRLVEAHGGHIGVESQAGKGATFWFSIPEISHA